ncbi:MAG: hypothetical protein ACJ76H_15425 [Bacteriovoracaceae bacterium]
MWEFLLPAFLSILGFIYLIRMQLRRADIRLFKISSPCSQYWSDFQGDSKKRFCELCQKNVINVCAISKTERKYLMKRVESGERVCVYIEPSFMRRAGYFAAAILISGITLAGFKEVKRRQLSSGILGSFSLDKTKFQDFGK